MISLVHFIHGLGMGGAETLVKDYALLMNKDKYDITVLCYNRYGAPYEKILEKSGIKVIYMCDEISTWGKKGVIAKIKNRYASFFELRKNLKKINPDIIHYHLALSKYVAFSRSGKDCKIVLTVHTEPTVLWNKKDVMGQIDFFFTKKLVKKYDFKMISLHEKMKRELQELFPSCNIYTVNNGINFDRFYVEESKESIRKTLGIPENAFVIGHVGRFFSEKNHSFLIDIFSEIIKHNNNAFLLMVGVGPDQKRSIEKMENLGLSESSIILENRSDIPRIMKAMDFLAFPSIYEGLPVVLIEAQKMRLKCLISEKISDDVLITNYIRKYSLEKSAQEWKNAILSFYNEKVVFEDWSLSEWDMHKVCEKLEMVYES